MKPRRQSLDIIPRNLVPGEAPASNSRARRGTKRRSGGDGLLQRECRRREPRGKKCKYGTLSIGRGRIMLNGITFLARRRG